MAKQKETKVDHYKATESMSEAECLKYCKKKAEEDIAEFKNLSFDKDMLISGYMKMYYRPTKKKDESTVLTKI